MGLSLKIASRDFWARCFYVFGDRIEKSGPDLLHQFGNRRSKAL